MKNNISKNSISILFIAVVFVFGFLLANKADANYYYESYTVSSPRVYSPYIAGGPSSYYVNPTNNPNNFGGYSYVDPMYANAYSPTYYPTTPTNYYGNSVYQYKYVQTTPVVYTQTPVVYTQTSTAKATPSVVNNYYYADPNSSSNTSTTTKTTSNTKNVNVNEEASNANNVYNNRLQASAPNAGYYDGYQYAQGNDLTALSLRGSGGFMPSSIWQWFLVIILILAIIIVARLIVAKKHTYDQNGVIVD